MKVKSLYPIIVVKDYEASIKFYTEVLGYEVKHNLTRADGGHVTVLTNNNDFEIEIMTPAEKPVKIEPGFYGFRMNVDSIEEAIKELKEKGCNIIAGPIDTKTSINLMIKDTEGNNITLMEHKK